MGVVFKYLNNTNWKKIEILRRKEIFKNKNQFFLPLLPPGYPMAPVWPAIANIYKYIHTYKYICIRAKSLIISKTQFCNVFLHLRFLWSLSEIKTPRMFTKKTQKDTHSYSHGRVDGQGLGELSLTGVQGKRRLSHSW